MGGFFMHGSRNGSGAIERSSGGALLEMAFLLLTESGLA